MNGLRSIPVRQQRMTLETSLLNVNFSEIDLTGLVVVDLLTFLTLFGAIITQNMTSTHLVT